MKKLSGKLFLFIAIILLLAACSPKSAAETAVQSAAATPQALIAEGRLEPVNTMDQSFSAPGQIAEVLVKDGDTVETGQVLARLTGSPEAQSALVRAQQELLSAQQALDSLQTSADGNLAQAKLAKISAEKELEKAQDRYDADKSDENQAKLDKASADLKLAEDILAKLSTGKGVDPDLQAAGEARLASAKAVVAAAQSALDSLELKSTIAGTVVDLSLQPGQRVIAGAPLLTVADFSSWVVKTDNLTETEVVDVRTGQKVTVTLDALPGSPLSGEVTHINARFEEKRGDITYTVTVVLTQADPKLRWGMTAAVQFVP
jgi:multidrug efflux pump subunit AcrA (membrane-fusion protein)